MKQIYLVLIITTQLLVTSCGGLQRARVYERQTKPIGQRKPLFAHPNPEKYSGWIEFELLVPKPDKRSHPTALEIRSLIFANGHEKNYKELGD